MYVSGIQDHFCTFILVCFLILALPVERDEKFLFFYWLTSMAALFQPSASTVGIDNGLSMMLMAAHFYVRSTAMAAIFQPSTIIFSFFQNVNINFFKKCSCRRRQMHFQTGRCCRRSADEKCSFFGYQQALTTSTASTCQKKCFGRRRQCLLITKKAALLIIDNPLNQINIPERVTQEHKISSLGCNQILLKAVLNLINSGDLNNGLVWYADPEPLFAALDPKIRTNHIT